MLGLIFFDLVLSKENMRMGATNFNALCPDALELRVKLLLSSRGYRYGHIHILKELLTWAFLAH